jgi:hypothetical protein
MTGLRVEVGLSLNLQTEYDLRMTKCKIRADIERRIITANDIDESLPQRDGSQVSAGGNTILNSNHFFESECVLFS